MVRGRLDQAAGLVLFPDDADIGIHIGEGRHRLGQAGDVDFGIVRPLERRILGQGVHQGDHVHGLVLGKKGGHLGVDCPVLLGIEHIRVQLGDELGEDVLIHQGGAQHALFRLHIVGHLDAQSGQAEIIAWHVVCLPFPSESARSWPEIHAAAPAVTGRNPVCCGGYCSSTLTLKPAETPA